MMRALMSGAEPVGSDMRSLTGRDGNTRCASAGETTIAAKRIRADIAAAAMAYQRSGLRADLTIGTSLLAEDRIVRYDAAERMVRKSRPFAKTCYRWSRRPGQPSRDREGASLCLRCIAHTLVRRLRVTHKATDRCLIHPSKSALPRAATARASHLPHPG